jgi:hypothetical protein
MNREDGKHRSHLPMATPERSGLITYDAKDPDSKFPPIEQLRPPKGASNVLIILIDDAGFGSSSAFGGPCQTPNAERATARRFSQWRDCVWSDARVAGKRCRHLSDTAHIVHMVIAARQQRSARGRAQRRSVELIVTKPLVGQPLQGRHVDWAAESTRLAEPHVVEQAGLSPRSARAE